MFSTVILLSVLVWSKAACKSGGYKEMMKLQETLFSTSNYKTTVRPSNDYRNLTEISLQLYLTTVIGLNTKEQTLSMKASLRCVWTDSLLQWNPADYGGINHMLIPQNMIWKPDIMVFNSANDLSYLGNENVLIIVTYEGLVIWDVHFLLISTCKMTWLKPPFVTDFLMTNGEFEVTPAGVQKTAKRFGIKYYDKVFFWVKLKRRPVYVMLSLLLPVTLLGILSIMSFTLPANDPEKVAVSITCLLSFTVFLEVMDNNMPQSSDNLPLLVIYVSVLLTLSLLGVVSNIVILAVNRWEEQGKKERSSFSLKLNSDHLVNKTDRDIDNEITSVRSSLAGRLNTILLAFNCVAMCLVIGLAATLLLS